MMTFITDAVARLERSQAAEKMLALVSVGERSFFALALYASAACCGVVFLLTAQSFVDLFSTDARAGPMVWAFLGSVCYLVGAFVMLMTVMPHLRTQIRFFSADRDTQDPDAWPMFFRVWRMYFIGPAMGGIGAALLFVVALNAS